MQATATTSHTTPTAAAPQRTPTTEAPPRWMLRTGRGLAGFLAVFLLFDGGARVAGFGPYVEGTIQAGYPATLGPGIGLMLIACTVLYLVPRTAVLGVILLTGYLGGAIASNLRAGTSVVFPAVVGVLLWGALYLLDGRLRALIPLRRVR